MKSGIEIGLNTAILTVHADTPYVLVTHARGANAGEEALPFGPFDPLKHRTFEIGLRAWVAEQTGLQLGYAEQLYTFGDRGRHARAGDDAPHIVSVGYLALTHKPGMTGSKFTAWRSWYDFFPWEDFRNGRPAMLDKNILPRLLRWAKEKHTVNPARPLGRMERVRLLFGLQNLPWDEEKALERYELLYEAGLVVEARRDGRIPAKARETPPLGRPMRFDHRRILATAMGRLRAKLKYRPVIFELMPQDFTLTALQRAVEAISGRHLHKQNFRRLVEGAELVEATGETAQATGGRPAALYRFRRNVLRERPAPGLKLSARR